MTDIALSLDDSGCDLSSFSLVAKMKPLSGLWQRPIGDLISELNAAVKAAGVEFGENEFSFFSYHPDMPETFEPFRQIYCYATRGSNEGYYVSIAAERRGQRQLIGSAKTWDWASALAIAAIGSRLLSD